MSRLSVYVDHARLDLAGNELRSELIDAFRKLGWTCVQKNQCRILFVAPDTDAVAVRVTLVDAVKIILDAGQRADFRIAVGARRAATYEVYKSEEMRAAALGVAINIFAEERDALAWLLAG